MTPFLKTMLCAQCYYWTGGTKWSVFSLCALWSRMKTHYLSWIGDWIDPQNVVFLLILLVWVVFLCFRGASSHRATAQRPEWAHWCLSTCSQHLSGEPLCSFWRAGLMYQLAYIITDKCVFVVWYAPICKLIIKRDYNAEKDVWVHLDYWIPCKVCK